MLAGVAERMENLGGSAEKGLKVLPVTPVTSAMNMFNAMPICLLICTNGFDTDRIDLLII